MSKSDHEIRTRYTVGINLYGDHDATVADASVTTFEFNDQGGYTNLSEFEATGSSRRAPGDSWHPTVAKNHAAARALRALADRLEEVATFVETTEVVTHEDF